MWKLGVMDKSHTKRGGLSMMTYLEPGIPDFLEYYLLLTYFTKNTNKLHYETATTWSFLHIVSVQKIMTLGYRDSWHDSIGLFFVGSRVDWVFFCETEPKAH